MTTVIDAENAMTEYIKTIQSQYANQSIDKYEGAKISGESLSQYNKTFYNRGQITLYLIDGDVYIAGQPNQVSTGSKTKPTINTVNGQMITATYTAPYGEYVTYQQQYTSAGGRGYYRNVPVLIPTNVSPTLSFSVTPVAVYEYSGQYYTFNGVSCILRDSKTQACLDYQSIYDGLLVPTNFNDLITTSTAQGSLITTETSPAPTTYTCQYSDGTSYTSTSPCPSPPIANPEKSVTTETYTCYYSDGTEYTSNVQCPETPLTNPSEQNTSTTTTTTITSTTTTPPVTTPTSTTLNNTVPLLVMLGLIGLGMTPAIIATVNEHIKK